MHVLVTANEFGRLSALKGKFLTTSERPLTRGFISEVAFDTWKWEVRQLSITLEPIRGRGQMASRSPSVFLLFQLTPTPKKQEGIIEGACRLLIDLRSKNREQSTTGERHTRGQAAWLMGYAKEPLFCEKWPWATGTLYWPKTTKQKERRSVFISSASLIDSRKQKPANAPCLGLRLLGSASPARYQVDVQYRRPFFYRPNPK